MEAFAETLLEPYIATVASLVRDAALDGLPAALIVLDAAPSIADAVRVAYAGSDETHSRRLPDACGTAWVLPRVRLTELLRAGDPVLAEQLAAVLADPRGFCPVVCFGHAAMAVSGMVLPDATP
jgi:hypothetical protein